jgi:hypothetical protein
MKSNFCMVLGINPFQLPIVPVLFIDWFFTINRTTKQKQKCKCEEEWFIHMMRNHTEGLDGVSGEMLLFVV